MPLPLRLARGRSGPRAVAHATSGCQHRPTGHVDAPGEYHGRHHSEWIGTVQVLTEEDDTYALQLLLPQLVNAANDEADVTGQHRYGWYAEQLKQLEARTLGNAPRSRNTTAA